MLSYQNTVNQGLTERSKSWATLENIEEIDALLKERYMSYQTNFSKSLYIPNLLSNSDRFAKCAETAPKGGVFYGPNAHQSEEHIKSEEFVDLNRLLYDNSDESINVQEAAAVEDDIDLYNNFARKGATDSTNPFIFNKSNNIDIISNSSDCKIDYYTKNNNNSNNIRSGQQSTNTSASQSPTNVLSMNSSPSHDYYLLNAMDVKAECGMDGSNFFDTILYDSMLYDDKLLYTPENSCGPTVDFTDVKSSRNQPPLTLNLKGTFVNDEEINTPNIIDTIMEASEQPLQFITDKDEIFNESDSFFSKSLQDLTPRPSTSSPAAVSDTTDSFFTTIAPAAPEAPKKPGRPRKRRYDSDNEILDDEDDDETYVPPVHLRRKPRESRAIAKKKIIYEDISEDEDYTPRDKIVISGTTSSAEVEKRLKPTIDCEEDVLARVVGKRGRPPKHARSISSDDYSLLDPEEAKYREMRDRNNEASRKSRYKRKQKEMQMSGELEGLEMENVKLKAQVEELQKTVDRYRDNLMKVMLNKK